MRDKLAKLIDVKSIVTILLIVTLVIMQLKQLPTSQVFENVILMVIGFFFGKNTGKEDK